MPFDRPKLQILIDRAKADMSANITDGQSFLRRALLDIIAKVQAGLMHGLYGLLAWLLKQLFPDTAEGSFLERWASIWKIIRVLATKAIGLATFTGTDGAIIPAGTVLRRSDNVEYTTDAEATITAGQVEVAITASQAGTAGNADADTPLSLASPITGVQSQATSSAITGGAKVESDASLLARLLTRIRQAPHGGASFDYLEWAKQASSAVTNVWVYPKEMGLGTVTVRFMTYGATEDGIPDAATVAKVLTHVEENHPVIGDSFVVAPVSAPLNPEINITPNTTEVKAAIQAELKALIQREAKPGGTILLSHLREAVSVATGENDNQIVLPTANIEHATGRIATLGEITWGAL